MTELDIYLNNIVNDVKQACKRIRIASNAKSTIKLQKQTIALTANDHKTLKVSGYKQDTEYTRTVTQTGEDTGTVKMFNQIVKVQKFDSNYWVVI